MVHHHRRLILGILLAICLLGMPVIDALAEGSEVDITVSAFIVGTPGGLILTYISDYEVGIEWTMGEDAVNTMVRGAVGRLPENREDGYLVYYGDEASCSDTGVSLDETAAAVYYRAWSQNAGGSWEVEGISDSIEGVGMTLIFIGVFGLGFLALALIFRQMVLAFLAGLGFIGLAIVGWTSSEVMYDTYWLIGLLGVVALLVCFIMGAIIQNMAVKEGERNQQRYDKEFPTPVVLSEEDAYSQELDEEIERSRKAGR